MKNIFLILALILTVSCANNNAGSRKLVWSDEFNGTGLPDASKWSYDTAGNASGWGNNEWQDYTASRIENTFVEKIFPDEVEALRSLPLPPHVLRELWIRTQNERAWRRFYIFPDTTGEIGFDRAEGYINPHFRDDEWRASLQHVIAWYSIKHMQLEK